MTSQTRAVAEKMMETLFAESDALRADVLAEIEFSKSTVAALDEAATLECTRIDEEAAQRKEATRKMYAELAETERRRIEHLMRRLKIIDGDQAQAA